MTFRLLAAASLLVALCSPAMATDQAVPQCMTLETKPVALTSHVPTGEDYPPLSIAIGESGDSIASYVILPDGTTTSIKITHSSGSLRLDDAAVAFIGRFKFKPALSGGKPVACSNYIDVRWILNSGSPTASWNPMMVNAIYPGQGDFPPGAFDRKEEGLVVVGIATSPEGAVRGMQVVSGSAFGDLNNASLELVRNAKVAPPTINGRAVTSVIFIPIMWSLTGKPPAPPPQEPSPPDANGDQSQTQTSNEGVRAAH